MSMTSRTSSITVSKSHCTTASLNIHTTVQMKGSLVNFNTLKADVINIMILRFFKSYYDTRFQLRNSSLYSLQSNKYKFVIVLMYYQGRRYRGRLGGLNPPQT